MEHRIERVDTIPLILTWLKKMEIQQTIDSIYIPHTNWPGLSYGQLSVLFVTYVLHSLTHRLSGMESWLNEHRVVIEMVTVWKIGEKDATDDRLGKLTDALGKDDTQTYQFQCENGKRIIQAFALPTHIVRYDTTSFNVFHQADSSKEDPKTELLEFGHSKNYRPDLVQFKQGLGVLDPAGIPLITDTLPGNRADDRCYVPAWRRIVQVIGNTNFLYIADCKAASIEARAAISHEHGFYLFPMPMTGDILKILKDLVLNLPKDPEHVQEIQDIILEPKAGEKNQERNVGQGFIVEKIMEAKLENNEPYQWNERWLIVQSDAHAARQKKAFKERLSKTDQQLKTLKPKKKESVQDFLSRANQILKEKGLQNYIRVEVHETIETKKKFKGRGRPTPNTPYEWIEIHELSLSITHQTESINEYLHLAGWRIYVTNTTPEMMTLNQSARYYRDEYLVERGFHRFKKGSIPALPLFLRIPERIKGLMLLLTLALQALTSIEFVSRNALKESNETLPGLVPGNPKMKTNRPTAERLLSQFDNIHLHIQSNAKFIVGTVVETLTPLQKRILSLLKLSEDIYDLDFKTRKIMNST